MKRVILILALMAAALSMGAQGKIVTESIKSAKLGVEQGYNVYLPSGYDAAKHYPVIYLLHGLYGSYPNWVEAGRMKEVADQLITSGEVVPVVIIMPNAGDQDVNNYQNGYFNVPGWPYEDFFYQEFLPAVEKKFNCGGAKGQRSIMGLSMGGGGATVYAQRHADMYASCYAMSAWLDNKEGELRRKVDTVDKLYYVRESVIEHSALDFLRDASDETLGELRSVAWFIDCGDDDFLTRLNTEFFFLMKEKKVHSELRIRNGVHNWEYWHLALRLALPFASRNFSR